MRTKLLLTAVLLAAAGLVAGCGKNSVNGPPSPDTHDPGAAAEQTEVLKALSLAPEAVEDGEFESPDAISVGAAPAGSFAAISPIRFWRKITHVERSFEFAFADSDSTGRPTTAVVTVHKRLTGTFNILTGLPGTDDVPMDSALRVVRKPLADHWVRRLLLKRRPGCDDWHVVATSGVQVTSRNAATKILSLRVQATGLDTTITDPLAFFRLRRILCIEPADQVTLTVTTLRSDDVVFLLLRERRFRFHNNGDNTYTGVFPMPAVAGLRHAGVNAFSNGTLFDDEAPYDSQAWLSPLIVRPYLIAEQLP